MPRTPGKIVTRFAPSPTGFLHVGGARTALFNYALAKQMGGTFILRMEDTDVARSSDESTRRILDDLRWLGLNWDEGPVVGGNFGPYFQSKRSDLYRQYLERLRAAGRVYDDGGAVRFKMPEHAGGITVHDLVLGDVTIAQAELKDFIIFKSDAAGGGPTFHFANVVDDATMGVTHVLRAQEHLMNTPKHLALFEALGITPPQYAHMPLIFNPDGSKMSKRDKAKVARNEALAFLKRLAANPEVERRRSKVLAYDANFPITNDLVEVQNYWIQKLVERSESETKAAVSAAVLNKSTSPIPPSRTAGDIQDFLGKKNDDPQVVKLISHDLSLSLPEIDVHDFRESGYEPSVLLNYLALLGWNPGGNLPERFDMEWFVANFSIEGIGKSNAKFDRAKLLAFNAERLQKMPTEEFAKKLHGFLSERQYLPAFGPFFRAFSKPEDERWQWFAQAYHPRARTWMEPFSAGQFFLSSFVVEFDNKAIDKVLRKNNGSGIRLLRRDLKPLLENHADWTPPALHALIEKFTTEKGLAMGDVAQPLRVALTGTTVSPPIDLTLAILGKDATLKRINDCYRHVARLIGDEQT